MGDEEAAADSPGEQDDQDGVDDADELEESSETAASAESSERTLFEALRASDGEGESELTDEEREELRVVSERLSETIQKALVPQFTRLFEGGPLAKVIKDFSYTGRLVGAGRLIDTTKFFPAASVAKSLSSLTIDPPWMKTLTLINSDVYKSAGLGQSNLTALSGRLVKNADFDFGSNATAAKFANQFASQQTSFLSRLQPLLAKLSSRFYPPNLRAITGLTIEEVEAVVMLDGIALYSVPRTEIAEQLVHAQTTSARRDVLGRRWKAISTDCRTAVQNCTAEPVARYGVFLLSALDALDSGNTNAAQAMAASVIDTVINEYFGSDRQKYTPGGKTKDTAAYEGFTLREFVAFAPLWQAYQPYWTSKGDPIPQSFSRHATVHGVSARQFSRRNAVQAVMFAAGLLAFLQEEVDDELS